MKIILILLLSLTSVITQGQEKFLFKNTLKTTTAADIDYSYASRHYLGEDLARRMYLFEQIYTHKEKGTPMSPADKTIVTKPAIYYALKKANRYYRKLLKKNRIEVKKARKELTEMINICIVIYDQETSEFEEYLRNNRKPEMIIEAFQKVALE